MEQGDTLVVKSDYWIEHQSEFYNIQIAITPDGLEPKEYEEVD